MTHRSPWTRMAALAGAFALLALPAAPAAFAAPPKPAAGAAAPAAPDKPFAEWKKTIKDAEEKKGFFTMWKKRDNLYLELKKEQFNKPFLYSVTYSRGIGSNYLLGGLPLDDRMLQFERQGDRVMLVEINTRFLAPKDTPIDRARELSIANSVVQSFKIESEQDSTKAVLIDVGGLFVSDVTDLSENMKYALGNVSVRFDKERSALTSIKAFPDNNEVEAMLTFTPNDRSRLALETVPDNRYIPIAVHYSLCRLPETPMARRWADNRVGYFLDARKDFGREDKENFWVRNIHRWRLEKKDPAAAVSEPVKPIVYYLDHTIPAKFRPWVKEGVEKWQKAFEAAGFRNAILALDPPADSTGFDCEDMRYSSIRWITSHEPVFGAIGPSRMDPRTGEILDADVLFEASMFQNYSNAYRRYSGPEALGQSLLPQDVFAQLPENLSLDMLCMAGNAVADGGAMQHLSMLMDQSLPPGAPVPDEYLKPAVIWAVMHEVGHTLGLRHNFRSSTSTPAEHLHDAAWTGTNGLYSSVMEYPTPNIDHGKQHQGEYWTTTPGTYDMWAIRFGYSATGAATVEEDFAIARKIADESLQPGHEYSTDDDTYPADAPDPRSNIYDLGSDPLAFAKARTAYVAGLWRNPGFEQRVVGNSGDLTALRRAMDTLLGQYGVAAGLAVKYLGGSYMSRVERGQPMERNPIDPVPAAKQREALDFLSRSVWAADAMAAPPALLSRMAPNRWSQWGMGPGTFSGRHDYDWNDKVLAVQSALLGGVLNPALLDRMRESENRTSDPYRLSEHFDRLTRALWGDVASAVPGAAKALEGTSTRRDIQRAYVDRLANMVTANNGAPDDARALARLQLSRVDARCARGLLVATIGDNTRAHLLETRARIKRALEAGREADAPGPAAGGRGPMGASAPAVTR
ncbi:MAG: zinc-dependent metalloprotease [Candidatus Eisenbacteria bacterium]|nr:zinc-dependent metalloprotease [Candidatus Eisenbacteria bacterium]